MGNALIDRLKKNKETWRSDMSLRKGQWRIPRDLIEAMHPDIARLQVIVVRAELMFCGEYVEYMGYSPLFDPVADVGLVPPFYQFIVNQNTGKITARRCDDSDRQGVIPLQTVVDENAECTMSVGFVDELEDHE